MHRDLIRSVRQCKTAQEERNVIAKEGAALRKAFKEQDSRYRHRCVFLLFRMHSVYALHLGILECRFSIQ
jgi:AP-1 complex subunit gamma-1